MVQHGICRDTILGGGREVIVGGTEISGEGSQIYILDLSGLTRNKERAPFWRHLGLGRRQNAAGRRQHLNFLFASPLLGRELLLGTV
jgi:hypothetical protein